jgi:hypothetical protein
MGFGVCLGASCDSCTSGLLVRSSESIEVRPNDENAVSLPKTRIAAN